MLGLTPTSLHWGYKFVRSVLQGVKNGLPCCSKHCFKTQCDVQHKLDCKDAHTAPSDGNALNVLLWLHT